MGRGNQGDEQPGRLPADRNIDPYHGSGSCFREEGETAALSTDDYYRISDYVRGWNIKMLNAYIRGQRKKRKQKLFDF